jgi:hypothetical protein
MVDLICASSKPTARLAAPAGGVASSCIGPGGVALRGSNSYIAAAVRKLRGAQGSGGSEQLPCF